MRKCSTCEVEKMCQESKEPACCVWYLENVVIRGASVNDCTEYKPVK